MREGRGSRTAEQNALFRALESTLPESRRLFEDHLARTFLTWPLTLVARLAGVSRPRELVPWLLDKPVAGGTCVRGRPHQAHRRCDRGLPWRAPRTVRHPWCRVRLPSAPLAVLAWHHRLRSRPSRYADHQTKGVGTRAVRPAEARSVRRPRLQPARSGVGDGGCWLPRVGAHFHTLGRRNNLPDGTPRRYHPAVVFPRVARQPTPLHVRSPRRTDDARRIHRNEESL